MPKKPSRGVELARRINAHLRRFEADPAINVRNETYKTVPYFHAGASSSGGWVQVVFVSYQGRTSLKYDDAERYADWLDAGNVGTYFTMKHEMEAAALREALPEKCPHPSRAPGSFRIVGPLKGCRFCGGEGHVGTVACSCTCPACRFEARTGGSR